LLLRLPKTSADCASGHDFGGVCRGHKITIVAGEPHLNVANLAASAQDDTLESQASTPYGAVVGDAQVRRAETLLVAEGRGHCVAGGCVGKGS